jgi:hypothetical protein
LIARRLLDFLSDHISQEQFGFLKGRQIHEAIGLAQEGLHSIHTKRQKAVSLKVDLSKAFDNVSWLYLRLLLIHLGFFHSFVTWVLNCISTTSFAVLINGSASTFFKPERGLHQGCLLSPASLPPCG